MDQNLLIGLVVLAVAVFALYAYAPQLKSLLASAGVEMFVDAKKSKPTAQKIDPKATNGGMGGNKMNTAGPAAKAGAHVAKGGAKPPAATATPAAADPKKEKFADYASFDDSGLGSIPMEGAHKPQGCYPREHLNPIELLPSDPNSQWAQVNPQGAGDIQGKNFLSAGALIGINTIGQSLRNANLQLRAEPPCPQQKVSPWMQSTIEPDLGRRPLE